jgi:hypothetical protein
LESWMETYTGKKFFITTPYGNSISIVDIAHALSMKCRFSGHTSHFYSVAQHSLNCYNMAENIFPDYKELHLYCLMHDASEAILGDIAAPIKSYLDDYRLREERIQDAIMKQIGLEVTDEIETICKCIDEFVLGVEGEILMHNVDNWATKIKHKYPDWAGNKDHLVDIAFRPFGEVKLEFLITYDKCKLR